MFDELVAETLGARGAGAVDAWTRVESAACARRLAAMVAMLEDAHTADGSAEREQWCLDNWAAVCAHLGAAQRITSGAASGLLLVGVAVRERFPRVGAVFADGLIGYPVVRAIVSRGALVVDPDALRALDTALASALQTWAPMSAQRTEQVIDAVIAEVDPRAVRRTHTAARGRCVDVLVEDGSGLAAVFGTLFTPDAHALDARLDGLADTVCPGDPRTRDQRRADALGALAHGADRLTCRCQGADCPAALTAPCTGVVIHLITHPGTLTRPAAPSPGSLEPEETGDDSANPGIDDPDQPAAQDAVDPVQECAGLDGEQPPTTLAQIAEDLKNGRPRLFSQLKPATLLGGPVLPGSIAHRAALGARLEMIVHPGQAPPEPHYTPSHELATFVRCRDQTCRFPGCKVPATRCDLDHVIAWPYGTTCAANLACLCRKHHLLKTFWDGTGGWQVCQLPDGTQHWEAPAGHIHTTTPGSRLLFPSLSAPTAPVVPTGTPPARTNSLAMPWRRSTRSQDRTHRIAYERELNRIIIESNPPEPPPPF